MKPGVLKTCFTENSLPEMQINLLGLNKLPVAEEMTIRPVCLGPRKQTVVSMVRKKNQNEPVSGLNPEHPT
jgi:hypothetical protein